LTPEMTIALCSLLLSLTLGVVTLVQVARTRRRETVKDTTDEERRIARIEDRMELIWPWFMKELALSQHRPHPGYERRDALIDQFVAWKAGQGPPLSDEELREFVALLARTQMDETAEADDRLNAKLLIRALRMEEEHAR